MRERNFRVQTTDGLELAVRVVGPEDADFIVCVHGYPDNSTVWDRMVPLLAERLRVVTYDVRGAGGSDVPQTRAGYRLDQLAADVDAVIDAVAGGKSGEVGEVGALPGDVGAPPGDVGPDDDPGTRVHLLGHDWGSIQVWHAVCGSGPASRAASFTSVSGPELGAAGRWMRLMPLWPRLKQAASSWYIAFFHLPRVPELLVSAPRVRRALGGARREDLINGLEMYRANMLRELGGARERTTSVPVQVLAPTGDLFVSVKLQASASLAAPEMRFEEVDGSHWVVRTDPAGVASRVLDFASR